MAMEGKGQEQSFLSFLYEYHAIWEIRYPHQQDVDIIQTSSNM